MVEDRRASIQLYFQNETGMIHYPSALFQWLVHSGRFTVLLKENFDTEVRLRHDSVAGMRVLWSDLHLVRSLILDYPDRKATSMLVQSKSGSTGIAAAANDIDTAKNIISEAKKLFPPVVVNEDQMVPILFWHAGGDIGGPSANTRKMKVVDWNRVSDNYTGPTRSELTSLMERFDPTEHHGRLMLWHGDPGTGKTYAIRALAWAWRKWCRFEYITDPERLFGDSGYLMQMLLNYEDGDDGDDDQYRLLILEDSGELLTKDAKSIVGQGLSRLLGLADGLLGQGSRILTLITTNEDLGKFNPAVMRPGRCLSEIHFSRFGADEASAWLHAARSDQRIESPKALSELYAILHGEMRDRNLTQIGFRP